MQLSLAAGVHLSAGLDHTRSCSRHSRTCAPVAAHHARHHQQLQPAWPLPVHCSSDTCPALHVSSRRPRRTRQGSIVSHDSGTAGNTSTSVSTVSDVVRAAPPTQQQQQQLAGSDTPLQQHAQEIKGLKQLVQQQQALITSLQRDVQALKGVLLEQPSNSSSGGSNSSRSSLAEPIVRHQQQPQQQQQEQQQPQQQQQPGQQRGGYQPMALEVFQSLPDKIILVRHAESLGNVDATTYSSTPDYEVPLSARGWEQAVACGHSLRSMMEAEHGNNYKLFFMTSPYCRTRQTFVGIRQAFPDDNFAGVQEEVQLREQDFGNFQNPAKIQSDLAERNRFGRFYYRFPDGESGSDVYNRVSIFEDHLIRDMKASRFSSTTSLCLVTHGLTMRVFLMRFFNWTVESFLQVYNPPNATPIIVDKISEAEFMQQSRRLRDKRQTLQVKHAYRLRVDSKKALKMVTVATTDHIDLVEHNYMS